MDEQSERLERLLIRLVLAMMASADRKKIRAMDWWGRAKSALETAASRADSWAELVAVMGEKLQIEVLRESSASSISLAGQEIAREGVEWETLRRKAEREALFIVSLAQLERASQRESKERK